MINFIPKFISRFFASTKSCFVAVCKTLACAFLTLAFHVPASIAQVRNYSIDASKTKDQPLINLEKLGGSNPKGERIAVNNLFISKGGVPIIPITGEFHFSRYPNQYWDESIKKMKAGGINMIATYVFWSLHEEQEGKFNWSGDRDLRKFIELCAKNDIPVVVRIGPFCHGEIRNGGIPDWILGKPLTIRSNDPAYLHYAELLYNEIGKRLKGLYYKDGGPIVAVQIENEYQHSASPWGLTYPGQPYDFTAAERDRNVVQEGVGISKVVNPYAEFGNDHMRALKTLAQKAGIETPLYTATGWGNAAIIPNETLPVTAAYAYPTWTAKRELSPFYLFKDLHSNPDYAPVRYKPNDYPAFAAELGSGIMTTYTRRPIVPAESLDALINRCLGGGANGIGYYMYHGGSTPAGEHYFFNDEAYGYPKISYDFQAPIGEYGQVRPSFQRLKLIHYFINDFAAELAPMETVLPESALKIKPENTTDLRYALRTKGNSGFLFVNNFQDNTTTHDQQNVRINIQTKAGTINIPEQGGLTVKAGESLIFPFNFNLNGCNLIYATAQLLNKGDNPKEPYFVFFNQDNMAPEFCFSNAGISTKATTNCSLTQKGGKLWVKCMQNQPSAFTIINKNGKSTKILVVNKALAMKCFLQELNGGRHLIFTDALVLSSDKNTEMLSTGKNNFTFSVYPKLSISPKIEFGTVKEAGSDAVFSKFAVSVPEVSLKPVTLKTGTQKLQVTIPQKLPPGLNDLFLNINYTGDTAMGFLNNELVTDEFYKGTIWQIGLKRFMGQAKDNAFGFYFRPLMGNAPFIIDLPASVAEQAKANKQTLKINEPTYTPEYKAILKF